MNPITLALRDIFFEIPEEILARVFGPGNSVIMRDRPAVEARIREKVIEPKVRVDCNLAGAAEISIPLMTIVPTRTSPYAVTLEIPKELTNGRSITSVLSVTYGNSGLNGYIASIDAMGANGGGNYTAMSNAGMNIINANAPIPDMQTVHSYLIGENIVAVEGYSPLLMYGYLRCLVSHDEVMSTLKPQSQTWFSELCVLAVKAYIYNHYIIKMDLGELSGGRELQAFKMIIEQYSDASDLYKEFYRETWRKVSFMNDPERKYRAIHRLSGALG